MKRRAFLSMPLARAAAGRRTAVSIEGEGFLINGAPTYRGRAYKGSRIEGLLLNSRMAQGIFDDRNPATRGRWAYPDTHRWDPERNTREFAAAMPVWRRHGLLSFTVNMQGGSPEGYSKAQPWETGGIEPNGSLRPAFLKRLEKILDQADSLGMAPIVGCYYFGQDQHVKGEPAVIRGVEELTRWILGKGYGNVLFEVANETNVQAYDHDILKPPRIHELIERVQAIRVGGRRLLAGTSFGGNAIPTANVVKVSDFLLLHGNGVKQPERIREMVRETRRVEGYRPKPVLFNEDDHFDFDKPENNMLAAIGEHASWGYFDPGASNYSDGYQCPPVNWGLSTDRKRAFFTLLEEVTAAS